MTTTDAIRRVVMRDLMSVRAEIAAYPDDNRVWETRPGIANSAGTLALHLAGNVQHFIGSVFGATGYIRDRDAEFSKRGVSRAELVAEIDRALQSAEAGFAALDGADLSKPFPVEVGGVRPETGVLLIHLLTHLTWHLGQIDYHRRVVTGDAGRIGAVSLAALA